MDPDVHISALPAGTHVWSALGGSMLHPHVPPQPTGNRQASLHRLPAAAVCGTVVHACTGEWRAKPAASVAVVARRGYVRRPDVHSWNASAASRRWAAAPMPRSTAPPAGQQRRGLKLALSNVATRHVVRGCVAQRRAPLEIYLDRGACT